MCADACVHLQLHMCMPRKAESSLHGRDAWTLPPSAVAVCMPLHRTERCCQVLRMSMPRPCERFFCHSPESFALVGSWPQNTQAQLLSQG